MFQYTHETVLNNPKLRVIKGVTNPYTLADANQVVIEHAGEYYTDAIVRKEIYKTPGFEGKPGVLKLAGLKAKFANAGEYVLEFRMITPNQFYAEYASINWDVFGKPVVVGFTVPANAEGKADAEAGFKNMVAGIKLVIPEGNEFIKVAEDGTITGTSNYMTFDKVSLEWYDPTGCDSCQGAYEKVALVKGTDYTIDANVESFATAQWILENLRFPTYPNIRYASANNEVPVAGTTYVEYAFTYEVPRVGLGGLSGVGQGMSAVTRHIFYVPVAKVAEFEAAFEGFTFKTPDKSAGIKVQGETAVETAKTVDQEPKE